MRLPKPLPSKKGVHVFVQAYVATVHAITIGAVTMWTSDVYIQLVKSCLLVRYNNDLMLCVSSHFKNWAMKLPISRNGQFHRLGVTYMHDVHLTHCRYKRPPVGLHDVPPCDMPTVRTSRLSCREIER